MIKKLLQNKMKILLIVLLIALFAVIRMFENQLFYDPFLDFFKSEFQLMPLPTFDGFQLFLSLFLQVGNVRIGSNAVTLWLARALVLFVSR
jgi:exosortase F-associated protein